jgi:hypothetical protein
MDPRTFFLAVDKSLAFEVDESGSSLEQVELIDPTNNAPFDNVLTLICLAYNAVLTPIDGNDATATTPVPLRCSLLWERPKTKGQFHPCQIVTPQHLAALWSCACLHPEHIITILARGPHAATPAKQAPATAPVAPTPVVKKSCWGAKTPCGDRNNSPCGNRNGDRDSHRETRNVSFANNNTTNSTPLSIFLSTSSILKRPLMPLAPPQLPLVPSAIVILMLPSATVSKNILQCPTASPRIPISSSFSSPVSSSNFKVLHDSSKAPVPTLVTSAKSKKPPMTPMLSTTLTTPTPRMSTSTRIFSRAARTVYLANALSSSPT